MMKSIISLCAIVLTLSFVYYLLVIIPDQSNNQLKNELDKQIMKTNIEQEKLKGIPQYEKNRKDNLKSCLAEKSASNLVLLELLCAKYGQKSQCDLPKYSKEDFDSLIKIQTNGIQECQDKYE